jgi:hypothetical protein
MPDVSWPCTLHALAAHQVDDITAPFQFSLGIDGARNAEPLEKLCEIDATRPAVCRIDIATVFSASSADLKAATEDMSGRCVPFFTITPIPTRARVFRVPSAILPSLINWSIAAGVITATSKVSPDSIRFSRAPAVPFSSGAIGDGPVR